MEKSQTKATNVTVVIDASSGADSLRTHLVEHSGEKPDKCNQCDFTSSRADVLRTHLKCTVGKSKKNATSVTSKVI